VFYDKKKEILASQGWFSHIPRIINGYYISESYILKQNDKRFNIYQYNKSVEIFFEKNYCWELQKRYKSNIKYIFCFKFVICFIEEGCDYELNSLNHENINI
jgi:hypothetical protein